MPSNIQLDLEGADSEILDKIAGFEAGTSATLTVDIIVTEASADMLDARVSNVVDITAEDVSTQVPGEEDVPVSEDAPPSILVFANKDKSE
jgi:hypothetical protein|tara:strand:- start:20756 stop:21028 length:273 start_codon:yes stop_codon:yes gene_type:complete